MKFKDCDKGIKVKYLVHPKKSPNKSLSVGAVYEILDLEFPAEHFKGRIVLLIEEEECFKAFYPKYFEKV